MLREAKEYISEEPLSIWKYWHTKQNASTSYIKTDFKQLHKKLRKNLLNDWIEGSRTKLVGWFCHGDMKNRTVDYVLRVRLALLRPVLNEKAPCLSAQNLRWVFLQESTSFTKTAESTMCFQRENTWTDIKLRSAKWKTYWQNLGWASPLRFIRTSWRKQNPGRVKWSLLTLAAHWNQLESFKNTNAWVQLDQKAWGGTEHLVSF